MVPKGSRHIKSNLTNSISTGSLDEYLTQRVRNISILGQVSVPIGWNQPHHVRWSSSTRYRTRTVTRYQTLQNTGAHFGDPMRLGNLCCSKGVFFAARVPQDIGGLGGLIDDVTNREERYMACNRQPKSYRIRSLPTTNLDITKFGI